MYHKQKHFSTLFVWNTVESRPDFAVLSDEVNLVVEQTYHIAGKFGRH